MKLSTCLASLFVFLAGCGSVASSTTGGSGGGSSTGSGDMGGAGGAGGGGAGGAAASSGTGGAGTGGGGASAVSDPNVDGPYAFTEIDSTTNVAASGHDNIKIHCAYPTGGPTAGPYPVIVVAHGFQLPPSQYYGYVKRLASFGYVALTVDFPTSLLGPDNTNNANDLIGGLDWASTAPALAGKADVAKAGATGHSLGGKLSVLAATLDARFKATIVLDPVDGAPGNPLDPNPMCTPPTCVDVSDLMPSLDIPTGFLGEITDSTAGAFGSACAPAAHNYTTFYAGATSPSLEVTVLGANHMSFLDDVASCGITCNFCKAATAPNAQVDGMAKAYVVAFYERHLRGNAGYDTYLTGADAQARYVTTGQATIQSK